MGSAERKTSFRTIQKFDSDYSPTQFSQYESEKTGMRVVVVNQKGPKVYGFFALATEIHDDSGAPHTLEHLVFMGSKSYQYKGVLDKLATRAYSNTNAWTATDHTAYTLDTAGWEGFAKILPIYLEHVILPTLTDAGCYTEVHHVDGTGHDAGVVYSEMQGVQNTQSELMNLEAKRTMYPPNVGFRYETGGMMDNLRALTADRIRQFHRDMYQPKNLCLALVGEVDHDSLLDTLDDFESSIINDIPPPSAPFKRPWVDSAHAPPLEKTVVKKVEFPEEDESMGEISIGFFGPPYSDTLACAALEVLLTYVAGSSASLFDNVIVEKEQLASGVTYEIESRPETRIEFGLSGVATERLDEVEKRFFEIAKDAARKPFDMQYLKDCLHRITTQIRFSSESSGSFFADQIIADHLFGKRDGSQLRELASLKKWHDELMEWDDQRWREFFSKWIANAHHISVLGVPSANLSKKLKADEEARVKAQQELLGEAGLRRLAEKLEQAKAENDREIPREILEKFKTPGTDSIHFFPTTTARSGLAKKLGNLDNDVQKLVDQDDTTLPLFIHFEDIPSNFVRLSLVLNTHSIPVSLRPLLSVYLMNFFATPILRDGQKIDFEKIVTELEKDTIFYDIDDGSQIGNSELLKISFRVEPEKYEAAIRWIRTMLFDSIFDETRLKATITKMLADIPEAKRSGSTMSSAVQKMIHFSSLSSVRAQSTLVKALYLKRIRHLLASSPQTVIDNLEKIRSTLATFSNFRVLVIADLHKLKRPVSAWKALIANLDTSAPFLQPLDSVQTTLSPAGKSPGSSAFLVPMSTIDSSFALLTAKGVDSHEHPHLPGLMVAIAYLDAVEGPLWGAVRGTGLAYGTGFSYSLTSGLLLYRIYRSPNAYNAWKTSKEIIKGFVTGEKPLESYAMEGAISSIVVGFADEQPTMSSAAQLSFVNQVIRGIPKDWSQRILKRVREVTEQDVKVVLERYLLPVFEPATSDLVVTCAPIMQESLVSKFAEAGYEPKVQPLAYFQDDYGLEGDGDEGESEDDEDEDEDGMDTPDSGEESS